MKVKNKKRVNASSIVKRVFISIGLTLVLILAMVYSLVFAVAHGPSITLRNTLVNMAMQASATKWVPKLVLSASEVDAIVEGAKPQDIVIDTPPETEGVQRIRIDAEGTHVEPVTTPSDPDDPSAPTEIDWSKAVDGIYFEIINAPHCRAYITVIKDPSRVYTATASSFNGAKAGMHFWDLAKRDNVLVALNGGEYPDNGGGGNGSIPIGITYSKGKCVYEDKYTQRTFMGFDKNNNMVLREGMTRDLAESLGVRDGVCFQTNNILIQKNGDKLTVRRRNDSAASQRTAIGQREDGAVIFIVTDGRTPASLGASFNDMIDLMLRYGAVNAGMLDGGSSSMLYYRDYYNTYNIDVSTLDKYQKMGLVNIYKAFTTPRAIPTYFAVGGN